jgi:hypothetical protein
MKKHLQQLLSKISMKVVLNVKEPFHTTNQIMISNRSVINSISAIDLSSSNISSFVAQTSPVKEGVKQLREYGWFQCNLMYFTPFLESSFTIILSGK